MKWKIFLSKIRRLRLSKAVSNEFGFFARIEERSRFLTSEEEISPREISR
jgi:hypothetical protein